MSSRRQKLLARVIWYLQSSSKHITELITGIKSYYKGGHYRQVYTNYIPVMEVFKCHIVSLGHNELNFSVDLWMGRPSANLWIWIYLSCTLVKNIFTPQPFGLEGYCRHGSGGRAGGWVGGRPGGRLPNLRNPYLCNRLTDFLHSKFYGIV